MRRFAFLVVLAVISVTGGLVGAQTDELLRNPGFDGPFTENGGGLVADGWAPWFVGPLAERPDFLEAPTDRAIEGTAQMYSSFLATHRAGLYQTVTGLSAGVPLVFTANVWVWSTRDDSDPETSVDPGGVTVEVGIDPTGSIDPESPSIIWSLPTNAYDSFVPVSIIAAPNGEFATVFVRTTVAEARLVTDVYVDNASLTIQPANTVESPTDVPVESPTDASTLDPASTEEPVATVEAVTVEPVSTDIAFENTIEHIVQPGDSLFSIAVVYGSTIEAIRQANELNEAAIIFPGDRLIVPISPPVVPTLDPAQVPPTEEAATAEPDEAATEEPEATPTEVTPAATEETGVSVAVEPVTHRVRPGDSLMAIAREYGVNVIELGRVNGILNYNLIYVGQVLTIPVVQEQAEATPVPSNTPAPIRHFVQFGDSVYRIAARYGVTAQAIIEANNLENPNRIFYGQLLLIPR